MIDTSLIAIIPPIVASILTYIIARQKTKTTAAKTITDMQITVIEQIRLAEEKMREEIWNELQNIKKENNLLKKELENYRKDVLNLTKKLEESKYLIESYKNKIEELEKR